MDFNQLFKFIMEDNAAGDGGVFGSGESFGHGGQIGNDDFWNRNDARVPYLIGYFSRRGKLNKRKSKSKKKKRRTKS